MKRREAKRTYRQLKSELNLIILEWDPYSLYRLLEREDEFSEEVDEILAGLPRTTSQADVLKLVQRVFSEAFIPEQFPDEMCTEVADRIWQWWRQRTKAAETGHA